MRGVDHLHKLGIVLAQGQFLVDQKTVIDQIKSIEKSKNNEPAILF